MTIKRNDPCVCGSGKKYKKCCMNKETSKVVSEQQFEQYVTKRKLLIEKMRMYMKEQLTAKQRYFLEKEFNDRTNGEVPSELRGSFTDLWMLFFNRSDEGRRLIESFLSDRKNHLTEEEIEMVVRWASLTPRILQAVNKTDNVVTFTDCLSNELYKVSLAEENQTSFAPWYGTFSLIEPFNSRHMFYGVRLFEGPMNIKEATTYIREVAEAKEASVEEIMRDYYPEILSVFIRGQKSKEKTKTKVVCQHIAKWNVHDEEEVVRLLEGQPSIYLEDWSNENKMASFILDWYRYEDSEMEGDVLTAEVKSTLQIKGTTLIVEAFDEEALTEVKNLFSTSSSASFDEETIEEWEIPLHAEMKNMLVQMDPELPKCFSLFAQNNLQAQIKKPLSIEEGRTIQQLVREGELEVVETWMRQSEYDLFIAQKSKVGSTEYTADYNSIRKHLNLPLSPYVTGGDRRQSTHAMIALDREQVDKVNRGAEKNTGTFYLPLIEQFKEVKTAGKSDSTIRKYTNSLKILEELFDSVSGEINNVEEVDESVWNDMLMGHLVEHYSTLTKTQCKDFISVTKAFTKWVDDHEGTTYSTFVTDLLKEVETTLLKPADTKK
ncbi:SEC-C domain-containing protein [Alkalihalophilus lindianensis]|uniref:SEC-C domain-containing protein n=1 Tax=Alkalihalophilus lindianensis TaxID=1630542 RepID=A0ABU3X6Q1_9BACI|nr:SEC-C domain-containing protein [Alkalihalophilus lindianensis]MDV2683565.1 SEC-C domain-containing protein [Alkalihalophilus lindianensis]